MSDPKGSESNPIIITDIDGDVYYVTQAEDGTVWIANQDDGGLDLYPAAAAELGRALVAAWGTPEEREWLPDTQAPDEDLPPAYRALEDIHGIALELEKELGNDIAKPTALALMRIFSRTRWRKQPEWSNRYTKGTL